MLVANLEAQRVATVLLEGCMALAYQLLMLYQRFLFSSLLSMNCICSYKKSRDCRYLENIDVMSKQNYIHWVEDKFSLHQTIHLKPSKAFDMLLFYGY